MAIGGPHFSSVRKAKEALKARANELLDGYLAVIKQAAAAGDYETAVKGYQHLLEHMPDEDGERVLDISIDKPRPGDGPKGPTIQIGVAIGGLNRPTLKPAVTITEVESDE
jgi:hypothetical protein